MVADDLVRYYRNSLRRHAATLDELIAALRRPEVDGDAVDATADASVDAAVDAAVALAHRLRGTGASYGFPEISELAGVVDDLADPERPGVATPETVLPALEPLRRAVRAAACAEEGP